MATVTHFQGEPTYFWGDILNDALRNGTFTVSATLVTIQSGTNIVRFGGTGFVYNGTELTAGTITSIDVRKGAVLVVRENGFGTNPTFAELNDLYDAYQNGGDEGSAFDAMFAAEGLNIIGSAAADQMSGSDFNDTISTGGAGPDDGNFVHGSFGTDTVTGGNDYDVMSFMDMPVTLATTTLTGVRVVMNAGAVGGSGQVTGDFTALGGLTVDTTFTNVDRIIGTHGRDTFIARSGSSNTQNNDMNWVGGAGADRFVDLTDPDQTDIKINYDAEKFEDHGAVGNGNNVWGDVAGENGVIVNLSSASIIANVGNGNKTVAAGTARDTYDHVDTIVGVTKFRLTDTKDHFAASAAGSRVQARGGDDTLIGGDGRDNLEGGEGNDIISAADGDDYIDGGSGNDTINAGVGNFDYIDLSSGTDTVNGDAGFDMFAVRNSYVTPGLTTTVNGLGAGTITGTLDGDAVNTNFQNMERVRGSSGNDSFTITSAASTTEDAYRTFGRYLFDFSGSDGNDTYIDNSGTTRAIVNYAEEKWSRDNYDGHEWGTQPGEYGVIVNMSATSISVDVGNGLETVAANRARDTFLDTDTLVNIRAIQGTDAADYFAAGAAGSTIDAGRGNDRFVGGTGADEFYGDEGDDSAIGGAGDDTLEGDLGEDELRGGDGNDQIYAGDDDDLLFGDNGNDRINGDSGNDTINGGAGRDNLNGQDGDDTINGDAGNDRLQGQSGVDTLNGGAGNDELEGGSEDDILNGGAEADRLNGDDGNDTMNGGIGGDEMWGGFGDDTYTVDNLGDKTWEFSGEGFDTVNTTVSYFVAQNIDKAVAIGTAAITITGNNNQDDWIVGNNAANSISGAGGNDRLEGGGGIDTIEGDDGNDTILGGLGNDILTGGTGTDTFVFNTTTTANIDTITDFIVADDTIQLENAVFTALTVTGQLAATAFKNLTTGGAVDSTDRVLYDEATGALYYDRDGSGGAARVQIAVLTGSPLVTETDFVVI